MRTANSVAFIGIVAMSATAQDLDPFFSTQVPMQLDPSRTGADPGGRVSALHNDQWLQIPGAWSSDAVFGELSLRNTKRKTSSWIGIGVTAGTERMNAVGTRLSSAGIITAVHVRSGQRSYLSLGLELRWMNGTFGAGEGSWASQYDDGRYDAALTSGESLTTARCSWAEARAGISWSLKSEAESPRRLARDLLVAGFAADHLGHVGLHESGPVPQDAPMRFTGYLLGELPHEIWDNGFFAAELVAHAQGPSRTARVNVFAGKHTPNTVRQAGAAPLIGFKAGLGYRLNDALLVCTGLDYGAATFSLAYGSALASRDGLSSGRRTFEALLQVRFGG